MPATVPQGDVRMLHTSFDVFVNPRVNPKVQPLAQHEGLRGAPQRCGALGFVHYFGAFDD